MNRTDARTTHEYDGELVIFLIGMTINRPWRVDKWLPTFAAMPPMLKELSQDPDSGLMGFQVSLSKINPVVTQYWNSLNKLYAYAGDPQSRHRPEWANFNRRVRKNPSIVGIWHETYLVDRAESVYFGTPDIGLAAVTKRVPVSARSARQRIAAGRTSSAD